MDESLAPRQVNDTHTCVLWVIMAYMYTVPPPQRAGLWTWAKWWSTETDMLPFWWNFPIWLYQKSSLWQNQYNLINFVRFIMMWSPKMCSQSRAISACINIIRIRSRNIAMRWIFYNMLKCCVRYFVIVIIIIITVVVVVLVFVVVFHHHHHHHQLSECSNLQWCFKTFTISCGIYSHRNIECDMETR